LTWQLFILDAAKFDEYRDACRHLAAYTDQHGKHLLPPDFPVRLPE
jgi:hypothetical protein